jgi:hypothetical protein
MNYRLIIWKESFCVVMIQSLYKVIAFVIIFIAQTSYNFTAFADDGGDKNNGKIGDMIEEIKQKEKEKKEKEKEDTDSTDKEREKKHDESGDDSDESCFGSIMSGCVEGCFEYGFPLLFIYALSVEYAEYPYAESGGFAFSRLKDSPEQKGKYAYLKLVCEPAYLWDDVYGVAGRVDGVLSIIYASFLYQYNFSAPEKLSFSVLSLNAGFQFPIENISISLFGGGFRIFLPGQDILKSIVPSVGGSLQIFFPYNIAFEVYSLNAFTDVHSFIVLTTSLGFSFWRFALGAGFSYYDYDGTLFMGPSIRLTIWI